MAKLTVELIGHGNEIAIRKAKGKITFDEVVRLLNSSEMYNLYAGMLGVFQFRVKGEDYLFDGYSADDNEWDCVILDMVDDDSECPVCGRNLLFPQYCPDCGSARIVPAVRQKEAKTWN